jgi:hypothetical protein
MRPKHLVIVAASAMAISASTPSRANIITVTYTGTVSPYIWNGSNYVVAALIDQAGIFGPAGASLTGAAFTGVWQVDVSCSACTDFYSNAILSAVLTIQGRSVEFIPSLGFNSGFGGVMTDGPGVSQI